jgi:WD40 repeat protein
MEHPNIIRWNMQTRVGTHLNPGYWVRCAAFSPDGLTMATGGHQNSVTLWDVATWQPRLHLQQGGDGWVEQLAFSPDRGTLAVSESNGFVKLYEVATWRIRAVLRSHTGWIWGLAFSPDGRTLATGSHDRTIGFWDVQTGQERMTIRGLPRPVWATAFSPDGKTLGSLDQDGVVRLWPTASGEMGVTVEQNPSEPEYWLRRAALLVRRGDWDGARQDFLAAVELRPDDLVLLGRIASLCLRCDRGQEAATIYDRAIERSPANAILKARRAQLQPGVVAVWNFDAGSEDWGSPHQCDVSVSDGALIIKTQGTDPWIIVPVDGAAGWKELTLRVRTDQECQAQLFWAIEQAPQFVEDRSVHFDIKQGRWEWTEVKVRFQPESALTALRLDPIYDGEVHWEIDAATLASVAPPDE